MVESYDSLLWLTNSCLDRPRVDDYPSDPDVAWMLKSRQEKRAEMGPLSRQIEALLEKRPDIFDANAEGGLTQGQWKDAVHLFEDPGYVRLAMRLWEKNLVRLKQACDAEGLPLTLVFWPVRNQLGTGENVGGGRNYDQTGDGDLAEKGLAALCAAHGVQWISLLEPMQAIEPAHFPMVKGGGDDHYLTRAHDWVGMLLGERMANMNPCAASAQPDPRHARTASHGKKRAHTRGRAGA